ncbi:hypothetical protein [Corynebacterium parakroppenstedtii]|uniref:hypothetical protein n=1 Tax=Corynebacterium parakroppenstedtii TaxID=2828363 RepID=UPI001C8DEFB7|nr:hypothetical protein [Corynebacterium parakroppenstedtii]MBY0797274.1 hypothetical protein [Corynebacterium parakroppenstedtii]
MHNPTSPTTKEPKVAYIHLEDIGRSTDPAKAVVHGDTIPNAEAITAVVHKSDALELVIHPHLAQWCPDCLDEYSRRVEARKEEERRVRANADRACRRAELFERLRKYARAGNFEPMKHILVELDELDGPNPADEG